MQTLPTIYGEPWKIIAPKHNPAKMKAPRKYACHTEGCAGHYESLGTGLYWCRTCNTEVMELKKHGRRLFLPVPLGSA